MMFIIYGINANGKYEFAGPFDNRQDASEVYEELEFEWEEVNIYNINDWL